MIDFRQYKDFIRECVKAEDEKDKNWKWRVKSISKYKVHIYWEYLDTEFTMSVDYPNDELLGTEISSYDGLGMFFTGGYGPENWRTASTLKRLIEISIGAIAGYAYSCY